MAVGEEELLEPARPYFKEAFELYLSLDEPDNVQVLVQVAGSVLDTPLSWTPRQAIAAKEKTDEIGAKLLFERASTFDLDTGAVALRQSCFGQISRGHHSVAAFLGLEQSSEQL